MAVTPDEVADAMYEMVKEYQGKKKLKAGEGSYASCKTILGWVSDVLCQHLKLPDHRRATLDCLFHDVLGSK